MDSLTPVAREKGLPTFCPFLEIFIPFLYSLTLLFSTFRSSFCESTKIEITWFSAPGRRVEAHGSQCLVVQQDLKRTGDQMLQFARATSPIPVRTPLWLPTPRFPFPSPCYSRGRRREGESVSTPSSRRRRGFPSPSPSAPAAEGWGNPGSARLGCT